MHSPDYRLVVQSAENNPRCSQRVARTPNSTPSVTGILGLASIQLSKSRAIQPRRFGP